MNFKTSSKIALALSLFAVLPTTLSQAQTSQAALKANSQKVVNALQKNDMKSVSRLVDTTWGLRISPEIYVGSSDVGLTKNQVRRLNSDGKTRVWGTYDGEGGPIRLKWAPYWKRFIWNRNFNKGAQVVVNTITHRGNRINNLREFYKGASFVEYHLPATSMDKLDWSSLWLVWRKRGTNWRLVSIVHDEWST